MSKTNSVIEVNGNRYDALTGQLLNARSKVRAHSTASKKRVIDGFVIGAHHTKSKMHPKNLSKAVSKTPAQNLHKRPERAKTLVRTAVAKPGGKSSGPAKAGRSVSERINPIRELRAKTVTKHSAVRRFGNFASRPADDVAAVAKPKLHAKPAKAEIVNTAPRVPSMVTSVSHQKLERLLDEGLLRADAHKHMMNQHPAGRFSFRRIFKGPRWLRYSLAGGAVLMVLVVLVWRNLPAVAVHVASAKSGVHASMPAYTPEGFAYAHLEYAPGAIQMQFAAKSQPAEKFTLTQQSSSWNSAALEANALPKDGLVQTSEVKGTTVYIYGDHNDATWVNNNVLYSLRNQANLTSDQVLRIVQSL